MLAMDVWCFSKSTIRVDLEKHQTRLHYWGNSLCNFEESPLQLWGILLYNKHEIHKASAGILRMVNRVCEKSLMYAFQQQKRLIDDYMIKYVMEHEMLGTVTG